MTTFWFSIPISFLGSPRDHVCERKQDCVFGGKEQGRKDSGEEDLKKI